MKLCSLRNIALGFAMAAAFNSSAAIANCGSCHHKSHSHSNHHRKDCPTVDQVRQLEIPAIGAFNALVGNLNDIFVYASANPSLASLFELSLAELGTGAGGTGSILVQLDQILTVLGVSDSARAAFSDATTAYLNAALPYNIAVSTGAGNQNALLADWQQAGLLWAQSIINLDSFNANKQTEIIALVNSLINNQSLAIRGYNLVSPTLNFVTAVANDNTAHQNVTAIAEILLKQLLKLNCK